MNVACAVSSMSGRQSLGWETVAKRLDVETGQGANGQLAQPKRRVACC